MSLGVVVHQAPLSMGFSRQEYQSGLPCPPPGNLPDPGIEPVSVSHTSPALAGRFFTTDTTWEAQGKWKLMMLNTVLISLSAIWVSGYLSGKTPAEVCDCFLKCFIGVFFFPIHRLFRIYIVSNTFPTLYLAFETFLMVFFNEQKFWVNKILFISIFLCC